MRINDTNGTYFTGDKGLKQGDTLSPLLFNLVAGVFTKMLSKVVQHDLISAILPEAIPGGVVSLQYADDTILFLDASLDHLGTENESCLVLRISLDY